MASSPSPQPGTEQMPFEMSARETRAPASGVAAMDEVLTAVDKSRISNRQIFFSLPGSSLGTSTAEALLLCLRSGASPTWGPKLELGPQEIRNHEVFVVRMGVLLIEFQDD
jgi:hypothetical protein